MRPTHVSASETQGRVNGKVFKDEVHWVVEMLLGDCPRMGTLLPFQLLAKPPQRVEVIVADSQDPLTTYATSYHTSIMVGEVLEHLHLFPGALILDGTLGGGGHSEALLDAGARVIALDRDPEAHEVARVRLERFGDRFRSIRANYSEAPRVLAELGIDRVDGMLVDAGVSSHQLDDSSRGFSFREGGPLDMRMGPDGETLEELLSRLSHGELATILNKYGELKNAGRLAGVILDAWQEDKITDTASLASIVATVGSKPGRKQTINPATLVFQALRIALNDELSHLEKAVEQVPEVVKVDGFAAFISFHSLEDRIVKQGFRELANNCVCPQGLPMCACGARSMVEIITRKPLRPSEREVELNPRARSALLRVAKVI